MAYGDFDDIRTINAAVNQARRDASSGRPPSWFGVPGAYGAEYRRVLREKARDQSLRPLEPGKFERLIR